MKEAEENINRKRYDMHIRYVLNFTFFVNKGHFKIF